MMSGCDSAAILERRCTVCTSPTLQPSSWTEAFCGVLAEQTSRWTVGNEAPAEDQLTLKDVFEGVS